MNRNGVRPVWPLFFTMVVLTIWAIVQPSSCFACSCAAAPSVQEAVARSGEVFEGRVTRVDDVRTWAGMHGWSPSFRLSRAVELVVSQSWKGAPQKRVVVRTGSGGGDCGYSFQVGETYLVYAGGTDGALEAGMCGRTQKMADARADLAVLGAGQPAVPGAAGSGSTPWVIGGLVAAAGFLLLAAYRRKRRTAK